MQIIDPSYIHATIHDFKTNISKYIRALENGEKRAVLVYRRNRKVGVFIPFEKPQSQMGLEMEPYDEC